MADAAPVEGHATRAEEVDALLESARAARAEGRREDAVAIVEDTLRSGRWAYARLWSELLSLMDEPADYARIRALWLASPRRVHASLPVLRAVARAATIAGHHDDARALLRRAILLRARQRRRPRAVLVRGLRRVVDRVPRPPGPTSARAAPAPFEQRAAVALGDLNDELDRLGVRAFLISGTLLGYVRDADFIAWDKDIDVGVFTSEIDPARLEEAFDRAPSFLVRRIDLASDRLRVNHVNGVLIDVFPHYEDGDGRVWHDGAATRWWNSPFDVTTVDFLGVPQHVPEAPERYLDENYGNWRVPDPDFDARLDAPNVEVTDRDHFDTLLFFGLLDAIAKGNPVKRDRFVYLLRRAGEGAWLDRL